MFIAVIISDEHIKSESVSHIHAISLKTGTNSSHRPRYNDSTDPLWANQLMTLHPGGAHSSSEAFGGDAWLSFNLIQSGWRSQAHIAPLIHNDYATSKLPTFMGEGACELVVFCTNLFILFRYGCVREQTKLAYHSL